MKVLILGSGGREHALAWKIRQSPLCKELYIAPGNAGTSALGTNVSIHPLNFAEVESFVLDVKIDVLIVGPEDPLVAGIVDSLDHLPNLHLIGPKKAAAQLEGSKSFAKKFMNEFGIPTAAFQAFSADQFQEAKAFLRSMPPPYVLKADGLAAGKGVIICQTLGEAESTLTHMLNGLFGHASKQVVIESFLDGIEFSVFVLTDGLHWKILPTAKDYKRVGEGDTGLNTGGMGAISPAPFLDHSLMEKVIDRIVKPTIHGLRAWELPYKGVIFLGLIKVGEDPFVIEYNCRLGDPETEAIMPRISGDLLEAFISLKDQKLDEVILGENPQVSATVMYCSQGYPGAYAKGKPIVLNETGIDSWIFHAGTTRDKDGNLVSNGGRVLAVTSLGPSLQSALSNTYTSLEAIHFPDGFYRRDIGQDLISYL